MGYKRIIRKIAKFILASQPDAFVQVNVGQIQAGNILQGKKIVITGGGSGLGYAMAKKFISEGAEVVISGRNADKLKAAAEILGSSNCKTVVADVCDVAHSMDFLEKAKELLGGRIDCLVSNAGVSLHENIYTNVTVEGFDKLMPYLKDKTSAFAGLSGVGKSSILNKITDTVQKTGSVSDKIKRGKHTTRHVELLELECGGYVLDTPGFSSFEVMTVKAGELYKYFPEMNKLGDSCRFKGCSHISEPGCVIKELVSNGKISASRYKSYTELYNQLKNIKDWENK